MEKTEHIVILAAGDFPTHAVPLGALREADFVVCCDSAYAEIRNEELGMRNYVVVGDGDSLSEADKRDLGDRWIQVDEQDYNDLHKAMEYATSHFAIHNSKFDIIGATGRREDHTLGNISYLVTFAEEHPGIRLEMLTDYGRFTAMTGSGTFATFPRQQARPRHASWRPWRRSPSRQKIILPPVSTQENNSSPHRKRKTRFASGVFFFSFPAVQHRFSVW